MTEARRILVVDDDPVTERLLRSWYEGKTVTIFGASNGAEGLLAVARIHPDLILLDLMMPVLDGLSAARRLKADPATESIPVILLSARRDTQTQVEAFEAGADDYITKPYKFEEVDARIRAMLRKRDLYLALESKNRELEGLLVVDDKTGLANYRQFQQKLRDEWLRAERYGAPLSVVMLDLDDFKLLNDTFGHPAGDRALRQVATLVAGGARATDLAARYGGEEFAVLLPHTDVEMAVRVAERILAAIREAVFLADEQPSRLTASAGAATHPSSARFETADALVQAADRALYRAKANGKNQVRVHDAADDPGERRTRP